MRFRVPRCGCDLFFLFFGFFTRGENIANTFLQRLLLCGGGGVVAVVMVEDFYNFAQGLLKSSSRFAWSEMPESVARAAKPWLRIALTFAAFIFCTPHKKKLL
jgi:hypothetical protein